MVMICGKGLTSEGDINRLTSTVRYTQPPHPQEVDHHIVVIAGAGEGLLLRKRLLVTVVVTFGRRCYCRVGS
jgi:hypothetical protein